MADISCGYVTELVKYQPIPGEKSLMFLRNHGDVKYHPLTGTVTKGSKLNTFNLWYTESY